jgi:hypothetical protein
MISISPSYITLVIPAAMHHSSLRQHTSSPFQDHALSFGHTHLSMTLFSYRSSAFVHHTVRLHPRSIWPIGRYSLIPLNSHFPPVLYTLYHQPRNQFTGRAFLEPSCHRFLFLLASCFPSSLPFIYSPYMSLQTGRDKP